MPVTKPSSPRTPCSETSGAQGTDPAAITSNLYIPHEDTEGSS